MDEPMQQAVMARVDDLIEAVTAAERALAKLPQPSVSDAAAKMAYLFYASGHGWRRYLAESAASAAAGMAISDALKDTIAPVLTILEQEIAARPAAQIQARDGTWAIPCAACGADAVTMTRTRVSPVLPEQLVLSSLSPVTVFRPVTGPRMDDIITMLGAGDVTTVVRHICETQPGGCDARCPTCERVYCKAHYAIEAQWSGSWHEATYATCPLRHEHEID
jgi:hypothetical protein